MKVLIFIDSITCPDENHAYFANSFLDKGWGVYFGQINTLSIRNYRVYCDVAQVTEKVGIYQSLNIPLSHENVEDCDLVWMMSQPHPLIAKDVWQMLWMLSRHVPFVNSVESLIFLNNKNNLGLIVPPEHLLETYVSNQASDLIDIYTRRDEELWIAKPTNSSCGNDVFLLRPHDSNARVILQSMTGNIVRNPFNNQAVNDERQLGLQNHYFLLQAYCKEAAQGDKRVILAGGTTVAQFGRQMGPHDHRSNLRQGGKLVAVELTPAEENLCTEVARRFLANGVSYVGIDIAYPYILEFNIANPGGVSYIHEVTGIDFTPVVIDRVLAAMHISSHLRR